MQSRPRLSITLGIRLRSAQTTSEKFAAFLGLARTIYVWCTNDCFGREITKYTVIYGVSIQLWPTLGILLGCAIDILQPIPCKQPCRSTCATFSHIHTHAQVCVRHTVATPVGPLYQYISRGLARTLHIHCRAVHLTRSLQKILFIQCIYVV